MAGAGERALRRRVRGTIHADLDALGFPRTGSLDDLCRALGRRRGREVRLIEAVLPVPGPFGYWLARDDRDDIVYPRDASPQYRSHIILHELAHIMLGHELADEHALHRREVLDEGR